MRELDLPGRYARLIVPFPGEPGCADEVFVAVDELIFFHFDPCKPRMTNIAAGTCSGSAKGDQCGADCSSSLGR